MRTRTAADGLFGAGVVVAIVAGAVLRFIPSSHLWLDEALTVNIARLPFGDITEALRHDGHPPLYYWLLHVWMRAFGESDGAVRALSGAFSLAALPLAWVVGRRLGGRSVAVASTVVLATSPYAIWYGSETRMYSLVMLLVLAGWLALDEARQRPSLGRLAGVAACTWLLLLSHYWSIWLLAAVVILLLVRARRSAAPDRRGAWRSAAAIVVGGLAFTPWLGLLLHQASTTGTPWGGRVRPTAAAGITLVELAGGEYSERPLLVAALTILLVLGLAGLPRGRTTVELDLRTVPLVRREATVVVLTLGLGLTASFAMGSTFDARYAAVIVPLMLLVAGAGLGCFTGRASRGIAFGVVALLGLVGAGVTTANEPRTEAGVIAEAIEQDGATAGDVVVYCPDQLGPAMERLLPSGLVTLPYPTLGDPAFVDWEHYADRNAAADPAALGAAILERAEGRTIYLVSSDGYKTFEGQCEALASTISAARPNAAVLVNDDPTYFEHAMLARYSSPG